MSKLTGRGLLWPLVPIYAAAVTGKNWLLDRGMLPQRRLRHPVISVGSLSAGGAGKTPVVILLAEALARRGFEVRVLTRGYGRSGRAVVRVNPAGDAREFGDEPLLMARRLPTASVWVGKDRHRVGLSTERVDPPETRVVYLLDDGFQHRRLARDVDLVLLTRQELEERLLPAGNLRESLKALVRADVVLVREDEAEVPGAAGGKPVWVVRRRLMFREGVTLPPRPLVFCGLARPEGFTAMLTAGGIVAVDVSIFKDHHPYSERDIAGLVKMARVKEANGFLTTEKDAVKLTARMMERLRAVGPVVVPELGVELVDEEARIEELVGMMECLPAYSPGDHGRLHQSVH